MRILEIEKLDREEAGFLEFPSRKRTWKQTGRGQESLGGTYRDKLSILLQQKEIQKKMKKASPDIQDEFIFPHLPTRSVQEIAEILENQKHIKRVIVLGSSGRNKGARQYMDLGLYEKYGLFIHVYIK